MKKELHDQSQRVEGVVFARGMEIMMVECGNGGDLARLRECMQFEDENKL